MKFVAFEDLDMSQVDLFDRLSDFDSLNGKPSAAV